MARRRPRSDWKSSEPVAPLALDDTAVCATIDRIARSGDNSAADLARRLRERRLFKALDIDKECQILPGEELEETEKRRQREVLRIEAELGDQIGKTVLKDSAPISVYGEVGADQARTHEMISIKLRDGTTREITELSPTIRTLTERRTIIRFFFSDVAMRDKARAGGTS